MRVVLWNHFMASHSGLAAEEVIGRNLFECFPELPAKWLEKKIRSVFLLKNYAFTSWEQRPYLFRFNHNRPVTGGIDAMQQDCTFLPVKNADDLVDQVCISVVDATDTAIYQRKLVHAITQLDEEKAAQEDLILKLQQAQAQLQELANCDGLTGLANRRQFDKVLKQEWSRAVREATPLSLLMLDVDHFKFYNDTYGHQGGDACLQFVAQAIADEHRLRVSDLVARYGGEEFAVILPSTPIEGALVVGERMRAAVAGLELIHVRSTAGAYATISMGAACIVPNRLSDPTRLIAAADEALYRAKNEGRNRVIAATIG
jgi:diguanylate cyclase (GGDEF)-like protein